MTLKLLLLSFAKSGILQKYLDQTYCQNVYQIKRNVSLLRAHLPGENMNAWPADVMLPPYADRQHLVLDVCVISSLQTQLVEGAADEPGHAL